MTVDRTRCTSYVTSCSLYKPQDASLSFTANYERFLVSFRNPFDCNWNWAGESSISLINILVLIILHWKLVHGIFKLTETHNIFWLFVLLLATPTSLTVLYLPHAANIIHAIRNVFGIFWLTLISSIFVYRLSPWHPLAKYPGPLLPRLTKFYFAFISFQGKQHVHYAQLHQKYGDAVRVGL